MLMSGENGPNPRLQRTRLRAPLSRKPLGARQKSAGAAVRPVCLAALMMSCSAILLVADSTRRGYLRFIAFAGCSSSVPASERYAISQNAEFLKNHEDWTVDILGFVANEKCTAGKQLGPQRAEAVLRALVIAGVSSSRLRIVDSPPPDELRKPLPADGRSIRVWFRIHKPKSP
jgi:outer membrane protein OmpA-like peptidoglycan-associated protein